MWHLLICLKLIIHENALNCVRVSCCGAVQLLLARYSRTEDIITLTTVANNLKRPDLEGVLGPFSNIVAIRTDLSGEPMLSPPCILILAPVLFSTI